MGLLYWFVKPEPVFYQQRIHQMALCTTNTRTVSNRKRDPVQWGASACWLTWENEKSESFFVNGEWWSRSMRKRFSSFQIRGKTVCSWFTVIHELSRIRDRSSLALTKRVTWAVFYNSSATGQGDTERARRESWTAAPGGDSPLHCCGAEAAKCLSREKSNGQITESVGMGVIQCLLQHGLCQHPTERGHRLGVCRLPWDCAQRGG